MNVFSTLTTPPHGCKALKTAPWTAVQEKLAGARGNYKPCTGVSPGPSVWSTLVLPRVGAAEPLQPLGVTSGATPGETKCVVQSDGDRAANFSECASTLSFRMRWWKCSQLLSVSWNMGMGTSNAGGAVGDGGTAHMPGGARGGVGNSKSG